MVQLPSKDIRIRNFVSIPYADILENLECGLPPADMFRLFLNDAYGRQLGGNGKGRVDPRNVIDVGQRREAECENDGKRGRAPVLGFWGLALGVEA